LPWVLTLPTGTPFVKVNSMRRCSPTVLACLLVGICVQHPRSEARQEKTQSCDAARGAEFSEIIRPLLKTYCFGCHNANKRKAGLNLEKIETDKEAIDAFELWEQVGKRLQAKEMPPPERKQPTDDEREQLIGWVKQVSKLQVDYNELTKEQLERALAGETAS